MRNDTTQTLTKYELGQETEQDRRLKKHWDGKKQISESDFANQYMALQAEKYAKEIKGPDGSIIYRE